MSAPVLRLTVVGLPGPQGSKSFKGLSKAGKPILAESSAKVRPWRDDVRAAALVALNDRPGWKPLDEPLAVRMVFTMPKPESAPKSRRTWPMRYPDVSKLARSTEDALTSAGVWRDDARVVEYDRLAKVFPGEDPEALAMPGVLVEIRRVVTP